MRQQGQQGRSRGGSQNYRQQQQQQGSSRRNQNFESDWSRGGQQGGFEGERGGSWESDMNDYGSSQTDFNPVQPRRGGDRMTGMSGRDSYGQSYNPRGDYEQTDYIQSYGNVDRSEQGGTGRMSAMGNTPNRGSGQSGYGNTDYNQSSYGSDQYQSGYGRTSSTSNSPGQYGQSGYGQNYGSSQGYGQGGYGQSWGQGSHEGSYGGASYGQGSSFGQGGYSPSSYDQGSSYGQSGTGRGTHQSERDQWSGSQGGFSGQRSQNQFGSSGYGQSQTSHAGKGPKGYKRSDDRIREEVSDALEQDSQIDASEIEVSVKEGVVTLSGTVESRHLKRMAEDCVSDVRGVKDVTNNLQVQSSHGGSSKSASSDSSTGGRGDTGSQSSSQDDESRSSSAKSGRKLN